MSTTVYYRVDIITQRGSGVWNDSGRTKGFDDQPLTEQTARDLVLSLQAAYPKCQFRIVKVTIAEDLVN